MRTVPLTLADSLFGRTRAALLGHVLGHPDEWFHLRHIARESGASAGTAHRELQALVDLGLLLRESSGAAVRFRANTSHPVFAELQSLLAKTGGLPAMLRAGIAPLGDAGEFAKSGENRKAAPARSPARRNPTVAARPRTQPRRRVDQRT